MPPWMTYKLCHEEEKYETSLEKERFLSAIARRPPMRESFKIISRSQSFLFSGKGFCWGPNVQCPRAKLDKLIGFDRTNDASFR